jgi:hypothetical protein
MVRTFIITMAGGMATWRPITLPEEKLLLPYRISMTRVYKVRKLSALFGDYPFQLDDFEKGMIYLIKQRKQMADFN